MDLSSSSNDHPYLCLGNVQYIILFEDHTKEFDTYRKSPNVDSTEGGTKLSWCSQIQIGNSEPATSSRYVIDINIYAW